MATKEKVEEQADVKEPDETTAVAQETKISYSQEEVDALVATREEVARKTEFDRLNPILSEKGAELKRLQEQQAQPPKQTDDDLLQILIDERKGKVSEYGEADPVIPRLEAIVSKRKQTQSQAQIRSFTQKADTIYKKAEEAYGDDDVDNLHSIRTLIRAGDFDLAEKKIAKATKKGEPRKEAEPKDDTFVSEEAKRKWMEERGLLESDTNLPSGAGGHYSAEAIGKMSHKEWVEKGKPKSTK